MTYRVPDEVKAYVDAEAKRRGVCAADVWREWTLAQYRRVQSNGGLRVGRSGGA